MEHLRSVEAVKEYENLFIAGTDQGFLGIVEQASGISIANRYVLSG